MLDYFNTRQQQSTKSPIKRKPYLAHGISIQSPQQFQKPHSLISQHTFVNPYLSYEKNRQQSILNPKLSNINPTWTKKIDLNQIETQKSFIRNNNQLSQLSPQNRFRKQLSVSKARFRLTKGEFTSYLQRNSSIKLFGPLQGRQRNQSKSLLTKQLIAQHSHMKLTQHFDRLTQYRSLLVDSKQPFEEKHLLQRSRFAFRQGQKRELQQRKKSKKYDLYVLPQLLLNRTNQFHNNSSSWYRQQTEQQHGEERRQQQFNNMQLSLLLSDKSIQKLHSLRGFNCTQRYFSIDANSNNNSKKKMSKVNNNTQRETMY